MGVLEMCCMTVEIHSVPEGDGVRECIFPWPQEGVRRSGKKKKILRRRRKRWGKKKKNVLCHCGTRDCPHSSYFLREEDEPPPEVSRELDPRPSRRCSRRRRLDSSAYKRSRYTDTGSLQPRPPPDTQWALVTHPGHAKEEKVGDCHTLCCHPEGW